MSASGIYLQYDGGPVDLDDLSWYEQAPCGCFCGVTLAYSDYGKPALVIASEEQAMAQFWETKREREKYQRLGFKMVLGLRSEVREKLSTRSECPHTPTFGYERRPEIEGFTWAASASYDSRSPLMHLVADEAVAAYKERQYGYGRTKPLCGGKEQYAWSEDEAKWSKVECSRCEKKARAQVTA